MTKLNWRDASKELPKNGDICLVVNECGHVFTAWFDEIDGCWDSPDPIGTEDKVTHWIYADELPLPNDE